MPPWRRCTSPKPTMTIRTSDRKPFLQELCIPAIDLISDRVRSVRPARHEEQIWPARLSESHVRLSMDRLETKAAASPELSREEAKKGRESTVPAAENPNSHP